jgi:hypothetical protein
MQNCLLYKKVVTSAENWALVPYMRKKYKINPCRACGLLALWESILYYKPKDRNDDALRTTTPFVGHERTDKGSIVWINIHRQLVGQLQRFRHTSRSSVRSSSATTAHGERLKTYLRK